MPKNDEDNQASRFSAWHFVAWPLFLFTIAWFVFAGMWALGLSQQATDQWIGEPWSIPFLPYGDSGFYAVPFAPFHALFSRGDWLPMASLFVLGCGTMVLWWLTKQAAKRAFRKDG